MAAVALPTFLYDGDCAFCSSCARFIERRIPTTAQVVPWQFADLHALDLTAEQCAEAVQWVAPDGSTAAGPDAVARLLQDSRSVWRPIGRVLAWRPVRALAWPAYRWVARNRHRMPGGTAACALPARDRPERGAPAA
jgi:predicted DCC family thiol-disulfide oxidoreductase YuxK